MPGEQVTIAINATDNASRVFQKVQGQAKSFSQKLQGAFQGVRSAAMTLTPILGGIGGAYAVKKLVDDTKEFEDAQIALRKTSGMTAEQIKKFSDEAKALTAYLPTSTTEFLNVAAAAAQLGISGEENLKVFTDTMIKMATATEYTAESATYDMKKIADVMKIPYTEISRVGSAMNALSNTTSATSPIIGEFARRAGGAASTLELTFPQVAALGATLDNLGVSTEVAGTAMSKFFTGMFTEADKFAAIMKIDVGEWTKLVEQDAYRALELFLQKISEMSKPEMAKALDDLKLGGTRLTDALMKLAGRSDMLNQNLQTAQKAFEENTSLSEEYEVAMGGLSAKIDTMMGSIKNLGITIGESLSPVIKEAADFINRLAANLTKWMDENPEFTEMLRETAKMFADMLLPAMETGLEILKDLLGWFTSLDKNHQRVVAAITAIGAAMLTAFVMTGPAGAAISGLTALILGLRYLYDHSEGFRNAINTIGGAFIAIGEGISTAVKFISGLDELFRGEANKAMQGLIKGFSGWGDAVKRPVVEAVDGILEFLGGLPERFKQAAIDTMTSWADGFTSMKDTVVEKVKGIVGAVGKFFGGSLPEEGPLATVREGGISIGVEWIEGIVEGMGLSGARLKTALNATSSIFESAKTAISSSLSSILRGTASFGDIFTRIWQAIADAIIAEITRMIMEMTVMKTFLGGLSGIFGGIFGAIFGFEKGAIIRQGKVIPVVGAQEGLVAKRPTLATIAEKPGMVEIVSPEPLLRKIVREEAGGNIAVNVENISITSLGGEDPVTLGRKVMVGLKQAIEMNAVYIEDGKIKVA